MQLAEAHAALAAALEACDITSARELGHLLKRVEGTAIRGSIAIERVNAYHRGGILWRCRE